MAYQYDAKKGSIVINGWEKGIASSPHFGIGNLQNVNIYTEPGEVMCSFSRTQQTMTSTSATGNLTFSDSSHVGLSIAGTNSLFKGMWITVSSTSHSGELANGNYWVTLSVGGGFQLSATYNGNAITGYTAGLTATIALVRSMSTGVASATEKYISAGTSFYRYYILDNQGLVWVQDTALTSSSDSIAWFLPDTTLVSNSTGLAFMNGWLHLFAGTTIQCKSGVNLGGSPGWVSLAAGQMLSTNQHSALVGHQSTLYYTDSNLVGSIFPTSSYAATVPNIFSFASYTAVTTTGTATVIEGSIPYNGTNNAVRIQVAVFPSAGGAVAAALATGTKYYLKWLNSGNTFELYAGSSGGSALDIATGSSGTQYFNTYYPTSASGTATYVFSPAALTLPASETGQSLAELVNQVVVGTQSNALYLWGQVNAQPDSFILLPENNTVNLLTVNNVVYVFAGQKGNVYVTNGSIAAVAFTIPDYVTGMIEPYFSWGGAMYVRGRVFFGVKQLSGTSNVGGVWSFVPTQNFYQGTDTPGQGIALRLENQNSYATYLGVALVLLPAVEQQAQGVQYWAAWNNGSTGYGIDFSGTGPSVTATIETDIVPLGGYTNPTNFAGIEYKLAAPMVSGESIQLLYRTNLSFSAWTAVATADTISTIPTPFMSSRLIVPFANIQWIQFQVKLISTSNASTASFMRLAALSIYRQV